MSDSQTTSSGAKSLFFSKEYSQKISDEAAKRSREYIAKHGHPMDEADAEEDAAVRGAEAAVQEMRRKQALTDKKSSQGSPATDAPG